MIGYIKVLSQDKYTFDCFEFITSDYANVAKLF